MSQRGDYRYKAFMTALASVLPLLAGWVWSAAVAQQVGGDSIFVDSGQTLTSVVAGGNWSRDAAFGDLDGNGTMDAFVVQGGGGSAQNNVIWLGNSDNTCPIPHNYPASFCEGALVGAGDSRGVALADLDGDGDLDVYIANAGGTGNNVDEVYLNQGGAQGGVLGTFSLHQSLDNGDSRAVVLADMNGDTFLDAVVAGARQEVYWGDGEGSLDADSPTQVANLAVAYDVAVADLDGDGYPDVVLAGEGSGVPFAAPTQIFWNDGNMPRPGFDSGQTLPTDGVNSALGLANLDGDGDVDVFIASSGPNKVWRNDGDRTFTGGPDLGADNDSNLALDDLDGDGDVDAFVTRFTGFPSPDGVWLNNGSGGFTPGADSLGSGSSYAVALADMNGDRRPEAFVAASGENKVWINQSAPPAGTFADSGQVLGDDDINAVAVGDVDNDGDLDAVVGAFFDSPIWVNQGGQQNGTKGQFNIGQRLPDADDVALSDVDGDGDLDVALIRGHDLTQIWINQGGDQGGTAGSYGDSGQRLNTGHGDKVRLGDVDGDQDPDLLILGDTGIHFFVNQGGNQNGEPGVFAAAGPVLAADEYPGDMQLVDLDLDGDLDLFLDDVDEGAWINQGLHSGVFSATVSLPSFVYRSDLGDLDGDQDPDIFAITDDDSRVLLNRGGAQGGAPATFIDSGQSLGAAYRETVDLGDLDGDQDLDAFVTGYRNINVWHNQGDARFDLVQTLGAGFAVDTALGDLDGDGDLDAFIGTSNGGRVYLNGEDSLLPNVFLSTPPIQNESGRAQVHWWETGNVRLQVLLSHPTTSTVRLRAEIAYEVLDEDNIPTAGDDWADEIDIAAGETMAPLTAFPAEVGGAQGEIWNVYQGTEIIPSSTVAYQVDISLLTAGLTLIGPDSFDLLVHSPNALARNCFLQGIALMLGLPTSTRGNVVAAAGELDLELARAVRDGVMANSLPGRYYVDLYTIHSPELLQVTAENSWLAVETVQALQLWTPALQALVDDEGETQSISGSMVEDLEETLRAYKALGSPSLRAAIEREEARLDLASFAGLTMEAALERVNEQTIYTQYLPQVMLR